MPERILLAVVGSDPALKVDLVALREVENECGITRRMPARFARFEAILSGQSVVGPVLQGAESGGQYCRIRQLCR